MSRYDLEARIGGRESAVAGLWIFPGLVLYSAAPLGPVRYVAGLRQPDGWFWPSVLPSRNYPPIVWVDTVTAYPHGHRELTSEILGDFLPQARQGQRMPGVDYSVVMAARVIRKPEPALEFAPVEVAIRGRKQIAGNGQVF